MSVHVMLDCETLGTGRDAVILSIGAVKFNPNTIDSFLVDSFYCAIDPASCEAKGLKIDASTVMWWLAEERVEARRALLKDEKVDLASALDGFITWYGKDSMPTWSNGATFNIPIMENAFKACWLACPWAYRDQRCYRTFKSLKPSVPMENHGVGHHALDDATAQALHLKMLVLALGVVL